MDPFVAEVFRSSTRAQRVLLRGFAVVSVLCGLAIPVLMVLVPPKPGEEAAIVVMGVFTLLFLGGGVALWVWVGWLLRSLTRLLTDPKRITGVTLVEIKRGQVRLWAVHMKDERGKTVGLIAGTEATARQVVTRLQAARQA
jgi:predicted membrane-bound spermidine synthase